MTKTRAFEPKKKKGKGKFTDGEGIAAAVERINQGHAAVLVGQKFAVLRSYLDDFGREGIGFQNSKDFIAWHANERYEVNGEFKGIGPLWLASAKRRQYLGVTFLPPSWARGADGYPKQHDATPEGWFNLWRGYAVPPAPWEKKPDQHKDHFRHFADHIETNVAGGNKDVAKWIWAWAAHMVQRPGERLGVTPVLRGLQGVGKSKPGEVFGSLFPRHYIQVDNPRYLLGQFNAHLTDCLMLQADEGFWAGDKTAEGQLKGLVTSAHHMIESKGVDPVRVRNFIHLFVTSNNSWVVPAGFEERRFAVFDVGTAAMQNAEYFAAIDKEMDAGGRAHLLAYLLQFDLASVNLRDIPKTEALWEQKLSSLDPLQAWWMGRLRDGWVTSRHSTWPESFMVRAAYHDYVAYCDRIGHRYRLNEEQWAIRFREMVPDGYPQHTRPWVPQRDKEGNPLKDQAGKEIIRRERHYLLPALDECRAKFAEMARHTIDWKDGSEDGGAHDRPPDE